MIVVVLPTAAMAWDLDTIGVTLLRATTTNLNGAGIRIAQPEASSGTPPAFEVNPGDSLVNQPTNLFTYTSSLGTATNYPNAVGAESGHANGVASNCYGTAHGVATNVANVDSYDADFFVFNVVLTNLPPAIPARLVNQSFVFGTLAVPDQQYVDSGYDDYAAQFGTLFVSGAGNGEALSGNGGFTCAPATCYNGIGVGASDTTNYTSVGPTLDNGRAKPDISAPGGATSFSTPYVTGSAAVLLQAGLRGDGGSDTNAAANTRTLKALLLNGAVKPAGWSHTTTYPLDTHYGAGVLNVFNSYKQLAGGKHTNIVSVTVTTGNPHPPTGATGTVSALSGWDYTTLSSSASNDRINHYYFNISNTTSIGPFTATATLVWNRQQGQTNINDLDLYLYDTANSNLVAESSGFANNTEHLYVANLPPGRYDLQVWKAGGNAANGRITNGEIYALAWEFFTMPLHITPSGQNIVLSWPVYPAGFILQSATNLVPPITWATVGTVPAITNEENRVTVNIATGNQFFRLKRP